MQSLKPNCTLKKNKNTKSDMIIYNCPKEIDLPEEVEDMDINIIPNHSKKSLFILYGNLK